MTLNRKLGSMIVILWIGLLLIGAYGAWQTRETMVRGRQAQLVSLVDQATSIANRYYTLAQNHTLSEDDAKREALATIGALRYAADGYFSVNDSRPVMLMHPFKKELIGKSLASFADPDGNHLFMDIVKAGNEDGGGFVNYLWPKPGASAPVQKTSFSRHFAPWDWYLVTGMYMDDVRREFIGSLLRWLAITTVLGIAASAVMALVLRSVRRSLGGELEAAI